MYALTSSSSFVTSSSWASNVTFLPLRNRSGTLGSLPAGSVGMRVERRPVAQDLIDRLLAVVVVAGAVLLDALVPVLGRAVELLAVGEDLRQRVQRVLRHAGGVGPVAQFLEDLDEVELVGQLEPLDAAGQAGDGLVLLEGGDGVRPGLVLAGVVVVGRAGRPPPAVAESDGRRGRGTRA